MSYFFTLLLFLLGLSIGSFLNVLIDRLPRKEKITGRSYCEFCNKELKWFDLIPVLSFVLLTGKCRYCHKPLSLFYPTVELITGLLFVLVYLLGFNLIFLLPIISVLIVIFFTDLKYQLIPNWIVLIGLITSLLWFIVEKPEMLLTSLFTAAGSFIFFFLILLLTKGKGMGFGDVKLALLIGLLLGFPGAFLAFYLAFLTGGIAGFILILWGKKKLSSEISFGPFLIVGTLLVLFFQEYLLKALHLLRF